MAEEREDPEPGTQGAELEPRRPAELDPEQLRQFREFEEFRQFQQFKELQRRQDGGDQGRLVPAERPEPASRKRTKLPAWLLAAAGKLLVAALILVAIIFGSLWAIDHFLRPEVESTPRYAAKGGGKEKATVIYEVNPYEAVRRVYQNIGEGGDVCRRFDDTARAQFADNMGYGTCEEAATDLHGQVQQGRVDDYAESMPGNITRPIGKDTITVSSCEDSWNGIEGGPELGEFEVTRLADAKSEQWLITGHEAEPPCTR